MKSRQCNARKRSGVGRCRHGAGHGTDHPGYGCCKFHGGSSPNGRAAAKRAKQTEAMERLGLPRAVEPHQGLLEEIARTAGHIDWLRAQLEPLDEGALEGTATGLWSMYSRERDRFVPVCSRAISAGVAERQVKLAEESGKTALLEAL